MRKLFLIMSIILATYVSYGQDTIRAKAPHLKYQFSFLVGGFYKSFLGNKYIKPTTFELGDSFEQHQYERSTKSPTGGFKIGAMVDIRMAKHWYFTTGMLFCYRKDIFEYNYDTVKRYISNGSTRNIHNVLTYNYAYSNLEIPLMILLKLKRINLYVGANIPILSYKVANYSYIIRQPLYPISYSTSEKTVQTLEVPFKIYPSWLLSYTFTLPKHTLEPFIGMDFGAKKSFFIQGGLIFTLRCPKKTI